MNSSQCSCNQHPDKKNRTLMYYPSCPFSFPTPLQGHHYSFLTIDQFLLILNFTQMKSHKVQSLGSGFLFSAVLARFMHAAILQLFLVCEFYCMNFMVQVFLYKYPKFTHSAIERHLNCYQFLAITCSVNILSDVF